MDELIEKLKAQLIDALNLEEITPEEETTINRFLSQVQSHILFIKMCKENFLVVLDCVH